MIGVVLLEPEIPSNTGNIGRTCAATGSSLHLIEPLGFHLTERALKRAGMDYWNQIDVTRWTDYDDFMTHHKGAPVYYVTTKGQISYTDVRYEKDAFLMFGKESAGIPEEILLRHPDTSVRIPMAEGERSLNLANSVAIVLYEALRQNGFPNLEMKGALHHLDWKDAGTS